MPFVLRLSLYLLIFIFITACVYDGDEDDNFRVVNKNVAPPDITIELSADQDTILVTRNVSFSFEVKGVDRNKHHLVYSYFDGVEERWTSTSGTFRYEPEIDSGYVPLTIRAYVSSGTGSLADAYFREKIQYEKSWVLYVYRRLPRVSRITSLEPDDGVLKITWEKNTQPNFSSYVIYSKTGGYTRVVGDVADPDQNFIHDLQYVGGVTEYTVQTGSEAGMVVGPPRSYLDPGPTLRSYQYVSEKMDIRWSATRFDAFSKYEVYISSDSTKDGTLLYSTSDPLDTAFQFVPDIGAVQYVRILTYPKEGPVEWTTCRSYARECFPGERIAPFESIYFAPLYDLYIIRKGDRLRTYSMDQNELQGEIGINTEMREFVVSGDQTLIFGLNKDRIHAWDIRTGQMVRTIPLWLLPTSDEFVGLGLGDGDKLLISKGPRGQSAGTLLHYDVQTDTFTQFVPFVKSNILRLSANGQYVLSRSTSTGATSVTKLESDESTSTKWTGSSSAVFFVPDAPSELLVGSVTPDPQGSVYTMDIETNTIISRSDLPSMYVLAMNVENNQVFGAINDGTGHHRVYDYSTDEVLLRFGASIADNFELHGGYLFGSGGMRIKLRP